MSASNWACFATEVFYLNVKDHVAFDKLEFMWNIPAILQSIKCSSDNLHFFGNGIRPEGGTTAFVYCPGIVHQLWTRGAVLVCLLQLLDVAMFHEQDDSISLLEDTEHQLIEN